MRGPTFKFRVEKSQLALDYPIKTETHGGLGRIKITSWVNKCHEAAGVFQDIGGLGAPKQCCGEGYQRKNEAIYMTRDNVQ